jgi:phage/plasmid-like protein (TIGR03299 family)
MAHNLHTNQQTGKTSFVAVGEKAWHGLGQYVNDAMTAEQAIELGGLDYEVKKKKISVAGGAVIPGYWATVRTDTNQPLGIVSDAYHVVQNREVFGFFDSIIDQGEAIYQTAGALGDGEQIFITAKLPTDILVHGEQVENYVLLTSGHHGKKGGAIQAGFTSIRVVCNNTLQAALRQMTNKITILHFSNAKQKLETAAKIMGMTSKYTAELDQIFNRMAEVKITDKRLRQYIEEVMRPTSQVITAETLEKEYSTRFKKTVDDIMAFANDHSTQQTDAARGTVWGAYNAISGYFGYLKNYKSQEEKMNDLYFKNAAKKIETGFDIALSLI